MSEVISLRNALAEIAKLENEIRKGGVVVLPAEGSYLYVCDSFNANAVKRLHELRGDEAGVATSVAIGSPATLTGISANLTAELQSLADKHWPGLLTLYIQPNSALAWDLGDGGTLGEFAVRIPDSELLIALAKNIGPLAISSAALAGKGAARSLDEVSALLGEINFYVDGGELSESPLSTVVRSKVIGLSELEVVRVGAISLEELQATIPEISLATPS
jgi:tRNA threonylcarbamoyl adenosine modification protein (Sua5/YciO/YrdC/YwlC family)